MKALIIAVVLFSSCTKDWECTLHTDSVAGNFEHKVDFRGTTQEKNDFEALGTNTYNMPYLTGDSTYTIVQYTNCVID